MFKKAIIPILLFALTLLNISTPVEASSDFRISGDTRFDTAVEISKTGWDQSDTVVLSTAYNFPDALAGGPLAYQLNAPILLTSKDSLGQATTDEILRLKAKKAVILGSEGVVSKKVAEELRYIGVSVDRIGGKDRYATSTSIAKRMDKADTAVIAYGRNFPDALAVAPYAASKGYPILLTETDYIPEETKKFLEENNISKTIVVGGKSIISNQVLADLPDATRISGADRFQTNAKIIEELQMDTFTSYISTGYNFADALTGSVLAAKDNAALLLVSPAKLPSPVHFVLNEKKFAEAIPLGGTSAVPDSIVEEIKDLNINDTFEDAIPVTINKEFKSHLIKEDDVDYYKLAMDKPGNVEVGIYREAYTDWNLNIYDKDRNRIAYKEIEQGSGKDGLNVGLPAGEFYIAISDSDYYSGDSDDTNVRYTFYVDYDDSVQYEAETNDSISKATSIDTDRVTKGTIHIKDSDDNDYYKFSLAQPGEVELDFLRKENSEWYVWLYDENGNNYAFTEVEEGSGSATYEFGLGAGDYYLRVADSNYYSGDSNDANEFYQFTLNYTQSDVYEKEFNDSVETASVVKLTGGKYFGSIENRDSSTEDIDYYKFSVANPGNVEFNFDRQDNSEWYVYVYDSDMNVVSFTEVEEGSGQAYQTLGLDSGDYYIRISDSDYYSGDTSDVFDQYSFSLTYAKSDYYEKEYNDKHYKASDIELNTEYKGAIQQKDSDEDKDYYKFTLSTPGAITLHFDRSEYADWEYFIYEEDDTNSSIVYAEVESGYYDYESDQHILEAGTYYLKIEDSNYYSGDTNDYFEEYKFKVGFDN